jgi:hypothetical protein
VALWTAGTLGLPPVVGQFTGYRGEFYDQEEYKGRAILVRFVWTSISPQSARMEQSFSADGGKSWEANWVCELSRQPFSLYCAAPLCAARIRNALPIFSLPPELSLKIVP